MLLLPATALGWFLASVLLDAERAAAPEAPKVTAAKVAMLWQFTPAERKGFAITTNGADLTTGESKAVLRGDLTPTGHQLVSDPIPVAKGKPLRLLWKTRALSGKTAVGLMDARAGVWINAILISDKDIDVEFVPPSDLVQIIVVNNNSGREPPIAELGPARLTAN
ncbi:MAG: hypothetical protein ACKVP7_18030 [Hyphomicrobiaceae bacterium]